MAELKFQKVQMTPEELIEKKLNLKFCKISKDESDLKFNLNLFKIRFNR